MDKDSPRITAGELQKVVEAWGQKAIKKAPTSCYSNRFQEKNLLAHPITNHSIFSCQTRQMGLASMVR